MKRMLVLTAAAVLVAAPAVAGLVGNSSLSPSIAVVPPTQAVVDDHGGLTPRDDRTEVGDDRAVQGGASSPSATPSPTRSPEVGDDHGGLTDRDDRFEVGDDRDVNGGATAPVPGPVATSSADDSGHHGGTSGGGADDGSGHDVGDDHGGHGSDD